jgi:hypothetical protein
MSTVESSIALRAIRYLSRKVSESRQQRIFAAPKSTYQTKLDDLLGGLKEKNPSRIVVVGNGPSLKEQDLELLRTEFTICTNAFYHAYETISWRPTVLTIEDPLPAVDNAAFFNGDSESIKLIPYDLKEVIRESESTAYLNFLRSYVHWSSKKWPRFSTDVSERSYWGGTVSFLALQIAATLKPKDIILIGTDLSYVIPKSAEVKGTVITSTEGDPNHFNSDYFGAGKKWHVPETHRMQSAFEYAFHALGQAGIRLYNATHGGNLKVVPRASYEELFS